MITVDVVVEVNDGTTVTIRMESARDRDAGTTDVVTAQRLIARAANAAIRAVEPTTGVPK